MKHRVWLRRGPMDGFQVEIEDTETEIRYPFAMAGDPLALQKLGLPGRAEPIGGVVAVAVYFDSGYWTSGPEPMRIFEFLETVDP